jgi:hypothetical protein
MRALTLHDVVILYSEHTQPNQPIMALIVIASESDILVALARTLVVIYFIFYYIIFDFIIKKIVI